MFPDVHVILIIESDQPTADMYRRELSREYRVMTCTDTPTVLKLLQAQSLSAIVLEPALDGGRGWQLFTAIQQVNINNTIPIILCSTLDERQRGIDLGATVYLVKPTLPSTLRDTLRQVIKKG
ncbi:MAG: response regulator [Chloroflexi bacterium AL-W]|nr:response regulator [Chloroflexi bacterium AL-N1]NOK65344.1 response regulator [Chloroflexi bacterium AL-N10]NOK72391.1 response regulator [Chloroflexi bacterium AL-N5]NOK79523.1 response regulator [Chloroflexi bacterium AL-W]NOK87439.1 response regulator [Chloroflexi bacterium AL-N15]